MPAKGTRIARPPGDDGDEITSGARGRLAECRPRSVLRDQVGEGGIVLGTRGLGDLESVFLGSTSFKVVQLAEVPVTLVK
jgi:hypothetical protein